MNLLPDDLPPHQPPSEDQLTPYMGPVDLAGSPIVPVTYANGSMRSDPHVTGEAAEDFSLFWFRIHRIPVYAANSKASTFDLVVGKWGELLRVQIKSTEKPERELYKFTTSRGRFATTAAAYVEGDFDVIGFIALDVRTILFRAGVPQDRTISIPAREFRQATQDRRFELLSWTNALTEHYERRR